MATTRPGKTFAEMAAEDPSLLQRIQHVPPDKRAQVWSYSQQVGCVWESVQQHLDGCRRTVRRGGHS